jgi:hypothetical protein
MLVYFSRFWYVWSKKNLANSDGWREAKAIKSLEQEIVVKFGPAKSQSCQKKPKTIGFNLGTEYDFPENPNRLRQPFFLQKCAFCVES